MTTPIEITFYRFAGRFGPFNVKIPCGECSLTGAIIEDVLKTDCRGINVTLDTQDWLSVWWRPLLKGGWHAPIIMVNGKRISQGVALNRGILTEAIVNIHATQTPLTGTHLFGKAGCPHCERAKTYFAQHNIPFEYHDVVKSPRALYEMLARVKPIIGEKTPVTLPQIWIEGEFIGGADALGA